MITLRTALLALLVPGSARAAPDGAVSSWSVLQIGDNVTATARSSDDSGAAVTASCSAGRIILAVHNAKVDLSAGPFTVSVGYDGGARVPVGVGGLLPADDLGRLLASNTLEVQWVGAGVEVDAQVAIAGGREPLGAVASACGFTLPAPVPDPARLDLTVVGMDTEHTAAMTTAGSTFLSTMDQVRREACPSVASATFKVILAYEPVAQQTEALVYAEGVSHDVVRPYPGGRSLMIYCNYLPAAIACRTWPLTSTVVVAQSVPKGGVLAMAYSCSTARRGGGPFELAIAPPGGEAVTVPIYKPSNTHVLLEYARVLPDGAPNGTARLVEIVGEGPLDR